ncbi:glucose-1-phosphate adenylyltransferase [Planomicrobium sp. YIM 101495]|uniref:glucose-1-phosphate adenylyltransferase n=1 Tax=Planomicrobium sp. YIM 101495 TaxID=2665160 RepID=UPI0012B92B32|nr:glucose-1-phosphate adenylyltransferase [Planomicrobium sp. YIM 101495]MTD31412.1 glucose-1-phosphate adenylyltransferase [Planomicrobium sp. YIM 101495]
MKREVVAMLLAGGQGSRLKSLTYDIAKPALPFGGKYRIIDFPLSNCTNSGIQTVGVLTQYQPHRLHHYIGLGTPWDLDQRNGGVTMLPPFAEVRGMRWYEGTANAIYQNIAYLNRYDPELVLVLSGDHIYKMNYQLMIDHHKDNGADVTISVIEVPWEEASRFGIMNTDESFVVREFVEKPEVPESNLASMGVYVFNWQKLKQYLQQDNENSESTHDFGKDVIPLMLEDGAKMVAYPYKGYWKDVGTVDSYWEANMDLLDSTQGLNLHDDAWRIYSSNPQLPPQTVTKTGEIKESLANEGCVIGGSVKRSVLFQSVRISEGAELSECVVMSNVQVGKGAQLHRVIVPPGFHVPDGFRIEKAQEEVMLLTEQQIEEWEGSVS